MRQVLEYAVGTDDVLASLNFYKALGFAELETNDSIPYPYAAVSDGHFCLGLHGSSGFRPELRMVQPKVQKAVLDWSGNSAVFEEIHLDEDELHRATLDDPSGHRLTLIEARTFSPVPAVRQSLLGSFESLRLGVEDTLAAARFWAPFTDKVVAEDNPENYFALRSGEWKIGLQANTRYDAIEFACEDSMALLSGLARLGLTLQTDNEAQDESTQLLRAPEGTRLAVSGLVT